MSSLFRHLELPARLAEAAIDLTESGVFELAWTRADALALLDHLRGSPVVILGGDALASVDPLRYAHANWHADRMPGEDLTTYTARSQEHAREYIQRYPTEPVWFVLVPASSALS